ncbi:glycerophosphodiester phosphodiesterase family protein [Sunxiuqinia sp. sy24]|uniref:glycerophosphodiester phosphodiesterase family protein n=1 Tax=Sunxiuqinia sp. sy24 TaxID=3461495 RepID=UPI004045D9C0
MRKALLSFAILFFILSCVQEKPAHITSIIEELNNSESKNVLVAAHRGDWHHAPENSLQGIKNCIAMGVDIVEVDVRKTKDNQLVLMHDASIDRTTNGKGKVSDYSLQQLQEFYLKNNQGGADAALTQYKIPTLEEALLTAKGKVMLNLDKAYGLMNEIWPILQKTGTTDHIILKGGKDASQVIADLSFANKPIFYMPILSSSQENVATKIREHLEAYDPVGFEFILRKNDLVMAESDFIKTNGARVWVNTLWASLCTGHTDAKALENPDENWGWVIQKGANIIQTDYPEKLVQYLEKNGWRNF